MGDVKEKTTFCKTELLDRGWTQKAIRELLPEPVLIQNRFRRASFVQLWDEYLVIKLECTTEFLEIKEKKEKRSEAAKRAAERKVKALIDEINSYEITVILVSDAKLTKYTLEDRQDWASSCGDFYNYRDVDEVTMCRWKVNYIRHVLTSYDDLCDDLVGKIGRLKGYAVLKNNILDKIAEAYPYLASECERQKMVDKQEQMERDVYFDDRDKRG